MTEKQRKLRQVHEQTGQGYLECQQALAEAGDDVDRAVGLIRGRGTIYTVDAREAFKALFKKESGTAAGE